MDRLTEMEAFAMVVNQGGFTNAARKMGISKSAVSKHISSLESRLGARLLNRTTRRVSPTEIGLAYYDRACRVLNDAGDADAMPHLPMEIQRLHAVYPPGRYTQPKLRAFIDFRVDQLKDKGPMDW